MSVDKMNLDKMSFDEMTTKRKSLVKMTVDQWPII